MRTKFKKPISLNFNESGNEYREYVEDSISKDTEDLIFIVKNKREILWSEI